MSEEVSIPRETLELVETDDREGEDKSRWLCAWCARPLGEEGANDSYHDDDLEVYHADCCPVCWPEGPDAE